MPKLLFVTALVLAATGLVSGCLEAKKVPTQDLPVAPPWQASESLEYVLLDRGDGEEVGRGTLEVAAQEGQYEFSQRFGNDEDYDNSSIVVDADTLKPISGDRDRLVDGERIRLTSEYDVAENTVTITEIEEDGEERAIPHRLKRNYYDNDSSLFLWRALRFTEGFEANYYTVVTGSGEQHIIHIEVVRKERITVPGGTFNTWRLEIEGTDRKQVAWYADTPERPLVQYDNSVQFFQLLTAP